MNNKPKVVILAGGRGMRLHEETEFRPKPLVEIGGRPILWHIMKLYAYYGFSEFIICLGYKGDMIKDYFLNYEEMNNDFTIQLGTKREVIFNSSHAESDWVVTLADTGEDTMTGARVRKIQRYIEGDVFMLTYGDGVGNINIKELYEFHLQHGRLATVTGVRPPSRFGELIIKNGDLKQFGEKPQIHEGIINGGFFVFNRGVFDYFSEDDNCTLEREPLERLAGKNELKVYRHDGFWHCMDTAKDHQELNKMWGEGKSP